LNVQEAYYEDGSDYRNGSPHLRHSALHDRLTDVLRQALQKLDDQGLPLRVLEVGAGHGGFTREALALGCEVTAVDMSGSAISQLRRQFGTNPKLEMIYSPDGALHDVHGQHSLLLLVSVLHHIPNYINFLEDAFKRLAPGGALITFQDPMLYARHRAAHRAERAAYFAWRAGQGSAVRGLQTRLRRLRGILDESNNADMVEYHVVRAGVDEAAVLSVARGAFADAELIPYWSTQLGVAQRLGERLGLRSSFGVVAHGHS
jgi:SAM-dependent methyltransferase